MRPISSLSNTVILRQLFIIIVRGFQVPHSLYVVMLFSLLGKAVLVSHPFQGSYVFIFSKEFSIGFSWSLHTLVYTFFGLCSSCLFRGKSCSLVFIIGVLAIKPTLYGVLAYSGCAFGDRFNVGLRNKHRHNFLQAFLTAIIIDNCIYLLLEISWRISVPWVSVTPWEGKRDRWVWWEGWSVY